MIFLTLKKAWESSTMNRNLFESAVKENAVQIFSDGENKTYFFRDGSTLDCDSLNPFECSYACFVSGDLSIHHEFGKF